MARRKNTKELKPKEKTYKIIVPVYTTTLFNKELGFFEDVTFDENYVIARALDEITSMKILSRIEGNETKIGNLLDKLERTISERLKVTSGKDYSPKKDDKEKVYSVSLAKLEEMKGRLKSGYTSFWS